MSNTEKLMKANGIASLKKESDKERITALEAENAELKAQVEEQADALIELAELILGGE